MKAIGGVAPCAKAAVMNEAPTRRARENNMAKGVLRVLITRNIQLPLNECRFSVGNGQTGALSSNAVEAVVVRKGCKWIEEVERRKTFSFVARLAATCS